VLPIDVIAVTARAIAFAGIVVMTGAVTFRLAVLRRWPISEPEAPARLRTLAARAGAWAAASLILIAPARLYAQAHSLVDVGDPVAPMMANVLRTTWGRGWLLQTIASLVGLAGFLLARRRSRAGWGAVSMSSLALTLSPALMGHAVAAERFLVVSLLADWVHVTAAGAWVGALALLTLAAIHADMLSPAGALTARLIELFHPVALTGAAALAVTGVVSLLLRVDRIGGLLHSAYGLVFAVKLGFTLVVAGFGLRHARRGAELARGRG
jgi:putative copper export protein